MSENEGFDILGKAFAGLQNQMKQKEQDDKKVVEILKSSSILDIGTPEFVDLLEKNSKYVELMLLRDIAFSLDTMCVKGVHIAKDEEE